MNRLAVWAACAASLIIGLFFVFVWAPHPWGWVGFDQYYDLARWLAHGEPFPTFDVPWGYAYFLSIFYRLFGERLWIPLLAQVLLNATMPALAYAVAVRLFDERVALLTAALVGVLSFNTVYASTQSSDSVCNVLFMAGVLTLIRARDRQRWSLFALSGLIFGVTPQFRPNLILIPLLLAAFLVWTSGTKARAVRQAILLVAASALMLLPWTLRGYRLTGEFLPTTTHGGVQLWYGSLQTGPYLQSRAHNPRSVFEAASFPYTSLDRVPLILSCRLAPCAPAANRLRVVYWTDRDPSRRTVPLLGRGDRQFQAELGISSAPTTYYYYVEGAGEERTPTPSVFFVSADHLGDLDRHRDLLDVFDIIRLMRHAAWNEPLTYDRRLDFDGDGQLDRADAASAAQQLAAAADPLLLASARLSDDPHTATLTFADRSHIDVPHDWSGRLTDLTFEGSAAEAVLHTATLLVGNQHADTPSPSRCEPLEQLAINSVFYRDQPHTMRRYTALAFDNISRDPIGYGVSMLYRAARVFFIEGSDDPHTTHQFAGGGRIYRAAFAVSTALLALALVGIWLAWRRGFAFVLPAILIAYIPATLAFFLTNMRYSLTVQPLLLMFVAVTVVTVVERSGRWPRRDHAGTTAAPDRAGTQTAHRL